MALKTLEKLYEGADVSAANANLMYFRVTEDCTIKEILIFADSAVSADAIFNCKLGGADLFSGAGKPKILSGTESVVKTGLSISATKGDKFILALESLTETIDAPLTLLVTIDDGDSGGSLPSGDLNAATNFLDKIQGRPVSVPLMPSGNFGDNFNDNSLDATMFTSWADSFTGFTVTEQNNRLETSTTDNSGHLGGVKTNVGINLTNKQVQAKLAFLGGSNRAFAFMLFNGNPSTPSQVIPYAASISYNCVGFVCGIQSTSGAESAGTYVIYQTTADGNRSFGNNTSGLNAAGTYFRMRHSSTTSILYLETSTDGASWTIRQSLALSDLPGFDFTNVKVAILGGRTNSGGTNPVVGWDDFTSNITAADSISDGTMIAWSAADNAWQPISIAQLKTALGI